MPYVFKHHCTTRTPLALLTGGFESLDRLQAFATFRTYLTRILRDALPAGWCCDNSWLSALAKAFAALAVTGLSIAAILK